MKKRLLPKVFLLIFIAVAHFLVAYIGLAVYYRNAFEYGTWINKIYCTGKSIEEVNRELSGQFTYDGITIYDNEQNAYQITAEDIGFQCDFAEALERYLDGQNAWMWIESFWRIRNEEISPAIFYDESRLEACFENLPFFGQGDDVEREIRIVKTPRGYELINERCGVLNVEAAKQAIMEGIKEAKDSISLEEAGCYYDMELTAQMRDTLHEWELVNDFQDCHIVYQMGEELLPVDASIVCDWIMTDEEGKFVLDENGALQLKEDAINGFVNGLADEYDSVGVARSFQTTKKGLITVEGGIYGNILDREAEIAYLTEAFLQKKEEVHTPAYRQMAMNQGKEDIGSTYIEIDMDEQMMYYYLDGILQIETPVVTGNTSRRMGTPAGVNYVYLKQTNRILRGEGYASHVNFWMPVKGNIGIHDASWRSNYGGKIYQTNGSHGCINTPYEAMVKIYDMVEVGTPVVMYY
ncbi:MAG: L,D-transpeptidase/peptidoglycan binding protein [Lachnospiraceae bacterium]|nr:L,D-transpeptidase/peptidoglycan binding protein [Lachnospiraceae bacterium]